MALVRDGRIIQMNRFNGTDYDIQYPKTHIKQITANAEVPERVGEITRDGEAVFGALAETDYVISAEATTKGTSTLYTADIGNAYINYEDMDGVAIRLKFHTTTGNKPMLNVNGLGARPILSNNGSPILFEIAQGAWATLIYSNSLSGWIVQGWAKRKTLKTEIITATKTWKVPQDIASTISVRVFGGGGGGSPYGGGGGGHMATKIVDLVKNTEVSVTIGAGGAHNAMGGVTSFGTYVSANGGESSFSYSGALKGGGHGGSGGGSSCYTTAAVTSYGKGGNGSYGGGGGGGSNETTNTIAGGGDGGTYGGGGGGGGSLTSTWSGRGGTGRNGAYSGGAGYAKYGGGGGGYSSAGYSESSGYPPRGGNGLDTTSLAVDFKGKGQYGEAGTKNPSGGGGGGGYGGNGGNGGNSDSANQLGGGGGGGGGYGGNGGNGSLAGGGGGGGYGGNGGNGGTYGGGGGGGYGYHGGGGKGADASGATSGGNGGIAAGGGSGTSKDNGGNGGDGVCILTYWLWE